MTDCNDGTPLRSQVLRVTVTADGARRVYRHPWIAVRLDTKRVEIYDRQEGGAPLAAHPVSEIQIDWRMPERNAGLRDP